MMEDFKIMTFDGTSTEVRHLQEDEDAYEVSRDFIGGYLELVAMPDLNEHDIDMFCDEEGKLKGLKPTIILVNGRMYLDTIVGNVVFSKHDDEGNTISLDDEDIKLIRDKFDNDGFMFIGDDMVQVFDMEEKNGR